MPVPSALRSVVLEAAALLLSAVCGGCGLPGTLLCDVCRAELIPDPRAVRTPEGRNVHVALTYQGVAARCLRRLKDEGETLLARPLGSALGAVLGPAVSHGALVVPVPTSRRAFRRRGFRVPDLLVRRAGASTTRALRWTRAAHDQRSLGAMERRDNVRAAMRAVADGRGAAVVVVDDVVTTGATLDEAARALEEAGYEVIALVALAATPTNAVSG